MEPPVSSLSSLVELTERFSRRRIAVVGDLVADHYLYGDTDRVSREAPVLVVQYESSEVKLGGAANAAANARSLGGQVTAVGLVGKDEMGKALRAEFKGAGIRLLAAADRTLQTETKTRILAGGMNTTRQQMLRVDRGNAVPLPERVRRELARQVLKAAKSADVLVVSDYDSGVVSDEVRAAALKLARDGMTVCVDSRSALRAFATATVCKPNEPELAALTGATLRSERDFLQAGRRAVQLLRCRWLLVTRGRNGMAVFDAEGEVEQIDAHGPREAVDVTGAGDTVLAAFALGLAAGAPALSAARLANVAGALVVQKQGTATVSRSELARALSGGAT